MLYVTATSGTIAELYKQICHALNIEIKSSSKVLLSRTIKSCIMGFIGKKEKPVLIIDEASLIRLDVFSELHTLVQFEGDSKPVLPIILAGQNNLMDSPMFRQSRPLASRVVVSPAAYPLHHQNIAGCKKNLFTDQAVTAIHQGSGGLLRRANNLARGALVAAASEKCMTVSAEHVRIASTEII